VRPGSAARADTRSTVRAQARTLLEKIRLASRRSGLSDETRAHLADCADTLDQALGARLQRSGALPAQPRTTTAAGRRPLR
jgi:hypothetical protein